MRIDARKDRCFGWVVWHSRECREVKRCVWVDSDLAQYGTYFQPFVLVDGELLIQTHQAKVVEILPHMKLVLIDPPGIDEPVAHGTTEAIGANARRTADHGTH